MMNHLKKVYTSMSKNRKRRNRRRKRRKRRKRVTQVSSVIRREISESRSVKGANENKEGAQNSGKSEGVKLSDAEKKERYEKSKRVSTLSLQD